MRYTALFLTLLFLIAACSQERPYNSIDDTKPFGLKTTGATTLAKKTAKTTCTDTDYGNKPEAKGYVSGNIGQGDYHYDDQCFGNIVIEYVCIEGKPEASKEKCKRGCQNGFCT